MRMTNDFEHDKEVQKKKKLAVLKNEEYRETDQEDISDSDEREMYDLNEEEENRHKLKYNGEGSNCLNDNNFDNHNNFHAEINNKYFKQDDCKLNTESNFDQSKIYNNDINNIIDISKEKLNKTHSLSSPESDRDLKPLIEKSPKKPIFILDSVEDPVHKNLFFETKQEIFTILERENSTAANGKKRNNFASRKNTNASNNNKNKNDNRKGSLISNYSNNIKNTCKNDYDNNKNSSKQEDKPNLEASEYLNKPILGQQEALAQQESSKSYLSKKLNFIKHLPLEKLQDLIKTKKKKLEDQIFEGIKIRSELKADQILDISLNDYSEINEDISDRIGSRNINVDNLKRVIRVRNIIKGKYKNPQEKESFNPIEDEINKITTFKNLGPPSFLKINFKKETNMKYRILAGKFFGCQV